MRVSGRASKIPRGIAETGCLESWLSAVAPRGRSGKTVTVPRGISRLPCGCSREGAKGGAQNAGLLYPAGEEFRLRQLGRSNAWVHLGCPNGEALIPTGATRPASAPQPPRRPPICVDPASVIPFCSYCGRQGHRNRDCPHVGT